MANSNGSQTASKTSRRGFLKMSAAGAAAVAAGTSIAANRSIAAKETLPSGSPGCPPEVRAALSGPWPTIRTPFTRDGEIDYPSLRRMLDFQIEEGRAKAVVLTPGDSLHTILTDEEVAEVTKAVCRHVNKRAFVVAAKEQAWTGKMVQFAEYCKDIGADMLMAIPPDWPGSSTVDTSVDYYKAVTQHIPVMFNSGYLRSRGVPFAMELIGRLCKEVPGVMAMKDDIHGKLTGRICLLAHDRWAISAGGQKRNHINMVPYGVDGYLSTFITFKPEIAWRYWNAIESGDMAAATAVIRDYDMPFFDYIIKSEGSFDAAMHGIYELFGLATRYRRPPYYALSDKQMEDLAEFLRKTKILG